MADHPLSEVLKTATTLCQRGANVFQKFTCSKCGERLTMEEPNKFWEYGTCDKCGTVTNIKAQGCNYMLEMRLGDSRPRRVTLVKSD